MVLRPQFQGLQQLMLAVAVAVMLTTEALKVRVDQVAEAMVEAHQLLVEQPTLVAVGVEQVTAIQEAQAALA